MLNGKLVNLRAVEPADHVVLWRWYNDPDVMHFWGRPGNTETLAEVSAKELQQALRGTSRKYIMETLDGRAIGQIDYYDLDWQSRSAWVSIMIGERDFWGGGFGTDAMRTLLRYLFQQLGIHRVTLTVHADNIRAQKSYQKNGYSKEGTIREWAFFDGRWVDGAIMSVLDRDFAQIEQ